MLAINGQHCQSDGSKYKAPISKEYQTPQSLKNYNFKGLIYPNRQFEYYFRC